MSLNPNASNNHTHIIFPDQADISLLDLLLACVFLALCVASIAALHYWFPMPVSKPIASIPVQLISITDITTMKTPTAQIKPIAKPRVQTKKVPQKIQQQIQQIAKPVIKPKEKLTPKLTLKPKVQTKPKTRTHKKPDDHYDPFAPLVSSSNVDSGKMRQSTSSKKTKNNKRVASNSELQTSLRKQLTDAELQRYIGMMQRAVQKHWKVPGDMSDAVRDPLIIMHLKRNGSIASVQIASSSGSMALDESLIRAIHAAAPFILPQQQFEIFRSNRIRFHPLR